MSTCHLPQWGNGLLWTSTTSMASGRLDFAIGQRFGVGRQPGERGFHMLEADELALLMAGNMIRVRCSPTLVSLAQAIPGTREPSGIASKFHCALRHRTI